MPKQPRELSDFLTSYGLDDQISNLGTGKSIFRHHIQTAWGIQKVPRALLQE
jgi:hypothetical protein